MINILNLFGALPDVIKLGPVIEHPEKRKALFSPLNVASGQPADLVRLQEDDD